MKIRVIKETYSGLKPGVYDADICLPIERWHKDDVFVTLAASRHYVSNEHYELLPRPTSGMGKRVMTTTNTLTAASMLNQGFDVRVRDIKTGRFVKWDIDIINTNGSRPATIDYINDDTTLRYALPREVFKWCQHDGKHQRRILNTNGLVAFDETYSFAQYDLIHQRDNNYVFEIFG